MSGQKKLGGGDGMGWGATAPGGLRRFPASAFAATVPLLCLLGACVLPESTSDQAPAEAEHQMAGTFTQPPAAPAAETPATPVTQPPGLPTRWPSQCSDGIKNGDEQDKDCGGSCAPCSEASPCSRNDDCASKVCAGGTCAPPQCGDGIRGGAETDVDCGGFCESCGDGKRCNDASDCGSGVCSNHRCAAATCSDGVRNGRETDVDCGGSCGACADATACSRDRDCAAGRVCESGICRPRAGDGRCRSSAECGDGKSCIDGACCGDLHDSTPVGAWAEKAPMSLMRYYPAGVVVAGYIYVLGGIRYIEHQGSPAVAINERYDPTADAWTTRAPMPQPRVGMAVAAWRGHLHVFSSSDHWEYDPAADAWTIRSQPPISIGIAGSAAVVGQRIYIGVGTLLLEYDPEADTYTPRAAGPFANQYGEMLTSQGGKLYAMQGNSFAEFDPLRNAWTLRPAIPTPRSVLSSGWDVQVGGRIYVVAGGSLTTESYNPSTNLWSTHAPMPWPGRDAAATTAYCGRVYVIGGSTPGFSYTTNTMFHAPP